jgi:hypothetical protein
MSIGQGIDGICARRALLLPRHAPSFCFAWFDQVKQNDGVAGALGYFRSLSVTWVRHRAASLPAVAAA